MLTQQNVHYQCKFLDADKETFVEAAKYVDANCDCDIIDINMGCPVPKVTKNEAGARLLLGTR